MRLVALLFLVLAGSCQADLEGAPCPCLVGWQCSDPGGDGICFRAIDGGGGDLPDAGIGFPDAEPGDVDAGVGLPDASAGSPDAQF